MNLRNCWTTRSISPFFRKKRYFITLWYRSCLFWCCSALFWWSSCSRPNSIIRKPSFWRNTCISASLL